MYVRVTVVVTVVRVTVTVEVVVRLTVRLTVTVVVEVRVTVTVVVVVRFTVAAVVTIVMVSVAASTLCRHLLVIWIRQQGPLPQEASGTFICEDGHVVMAGVEYVESYQIHEKTCFPGV